MLLVEDKLCKISDMLKKNSHIKEQSTIINLCEDWWEMLRQEQVLYEVHVSQYHLSIDPKMCN